MYLMCPSPAAQKMLPKIISLFFAATRKCVSIQLISACHELELGVSSFELGMCRVLKWPQSVGNLAAGPAALLNFNAAVYVRYLEV